MEKDVGKKSQAKFWSNIVLTDKKLIEICVGSFMQIHPDSARQSCHLDKFLRRHHRHWNQLHQLQVPIVAGVTMEVFYTSYHVSNALP